MLWLWVSIFLLSALFFWAAIQSTRIGLVIVTSLILGVSLQLIVVYFKGL